MGHQKLQTHHGGLYFIIEEDNPNVGAYLYVFDRGECIKDYLQNSINDCIIFANENYMVPINSWVGE